MSALSGLANPATGRISTSAGPAAGYFRAMGVDAVGALVVADAPGAVPRVFNGSVNVVAASGAVCIDTVGAVAQYVSGLPITAAGDLCAAVSVPNRFDQGVGFFNARVAIL